MRSTGKSLRFVVEKGIWPAEWPSPELRWRPWLRVRGFPRKWQAQAYVAEQPPGETYRIRDLREKV